MKFITITSLLIWLSFKVLANSVYAIKIENQLHFNAIDESLTQAIKSGYKDVHISIGPGIYFYKENQLNRVNEQQPDVDISIEGEQAILIAAGIDYRNGDTLKEPISPNATFFDTSDMTYYDYWGKCQYADDLVQIADISQRLCYLPFSKAENKDAKACRHLYISIPQWYKSKIYKVKEIKNGKIYFTTDYLEYIHKRNREGYTINYDYLFGGGKTRFKLFDPTSAKWAMYIKNEKTISNSKTIHECRSCRFLRMDHVSYRSFSISGIQFIGNYDGNNHLLSFVEAKTEKLLIHNCSFEGIKSRLVYAGETSNLSFLKNTIIRCSHNGIESTNSSENTIIADNFFSDCGDNMLQTFCVNCKGKNYYIARNRFKNFGYSAIGLGVWHGHQKGHESSGIVEHNEIWYDKDYLAHLEQYTLMDSGAIYLWTQNDDAQIRYNYIHDYGGVAENHGVFCDDGASHFKLYGNIIINISDYSIDSRSCQAEFPKGNQDIQIKYNIVDKPIKFEGNTRHNNKCIKSSNIFLYKKEIFPFQNKYANLTIETADKHLQFGGWRESSIMVGNKTLKQLKLLPCYLEIKKYINKK